MTPPLQNSTTPSPMTSTPPAPEPEPLLPTPPTAHRRRGRIARLPKDLRHQLNEFPSDGLPYAPVLQELHKDSPWLKLTEDDLSKWYQTGHQDWLKERLWVEQLQTRHESALDLLKTSEKAKIHEATLSLAATQVAWLLKDL